MHLSRGSSDDPYVWLWVLGALALYALISYGLTYRARARRGSAHPARDALHDLKDREDPQPPEYRFISRVIMLCGAGITGLVAFLTSGAARVLAVGFTAVVAVTVWAYYDHRTERRASAQRSAQ
jgi:membrane protein implicated in regulation of membrane protease activity